MQHNFNLDFWLGHKLCKGPVYDPSYHRTGPGLTLISWFIVREQQQHQTSVGPLTRLWCVTRCDSMTLVFLTRTFEGPRCCRHDRHEIKLALVASYTHFRWSVGSEHYHTDTESCNNIYWTTVSITDGENLFKLLNLPPFPQRSKIKLLGFSLGFLVSHYICQIKRNKDIKPLKSFHYF